MIAMRAAVARRVFLGHFERAGFGRRSRPFVNNEKSRMSFVFSINAFIVRGQTIFLCVFDFVQERKNPVGFLCPLFSQASLQLCNRKEGASYSTLRPDLLEREPTPQEHPFSSVLYPVRS